MKKTISYQFTGNLRVDLPVMKAIIEAKTKQDFILLSRMIKRQAE